MILAAQAEHSSHMEEEGIDMKTGKGPLILEDLKGQNHNQGSGEQDLEELGNALHPITDPHLEEMYLMEETIREQMTMEGIIAKVGLKCLRMKSRI